MNLSLMKSYIEAVKIAFLANRNTFFFVVPVHEMFREKGIRKDMLMIFDQCMFSFCNIHLFHRHSESQYVHNMISELYPGPTYASKMESFAAIVNGLLPLSIVSKLSILDDCRGLGYPSGFKYDLNEY